MLDDAAKLDNAPPEALISPTTKSVAASERVKVTVVVSPAFNDEALDVIAIVGGVVSIVKDNVEDADDVLPAASVAVAVNE